MNIKYSAHQIRTALSASTICVLLATSWPTPLQAQALPNAALGSAFTYQGQLKKNGAPVTASCTMTFKLFSASSAGTQIGSDLTKTAVSVANGLFAIDLNFGPSAFGADERYLEATVQCTGDATAATLPRKRITAAPFSLTTQSLKGQPLSGTAPTAGQVLKWNGSTWNPATDEVGNAAINNAWLLTGNAGTNPTNNFIGTTDAVSFTVRVSNTEALRISPGLGWIGGGASNTGNGYIGWGQNNTAYFGTIVAGNGNAIDPGATSTAFIGSGTGNHLPSLSNDAVIVGGNHNQFIDGPHDGGFIGSGRNNILKGLYQPNSAIVGGDSNTILGRNSFIGGGFGNFNAADSSFIGGGSTNTNTAPSSVIVGGSNNAIANNTSSAGYIGGGSNNLIAGGLNYNGVIVGGSSNLITGFSTYNSFIGGGENNIIDGGHQYGSGIVGGSFNYVNGQGSFVGAGRFNNINGQYSTIPGGNQNVITGNLSFAAGNGAHALNNGAFVWASAPISTSADNQFLVRATGGVRFVTSAADNSNPPGSIGFEANGAIRVKDAGVGTATPLFTHRAAANTIANSQTCIDNPLTNNDPNAILVVTPNHNPQLSTVVDNPHPVGVEYTGSAKQPNNRWCIYNIGSADSIVVGSAFNVMVVKP